MKFFILITLILTVVYTVSGFQQYALYSLSMSAPNLLAIYSGNADGSVVYVNSIPTGGNGTGGNVQSQSVLTVNGNYIFAVNPASNSFSMFRINPTNAVDVTLIATASSQGEYPITITADGKSVCVANSGAVSTIACYAYNAQGLTFSTVRNLNLNLTTPPEFHTGPGQISFTPDGTGVIVVVKGRNPPFYLFTVSYYGSTIQLASTPAVTPAAGSSNFDLAFDSSNSFVVVDTNPFGNNNSSSGARLVRFSTSGSGSISFPTSDYLQFPGLHGACWVSYSPEADLFYASDTGSGILTVLKRVGNDLTVLNNFPIGTQPGDSVVFNVNGQDYLYVTERGTQTIWVLRLGSGGLDATSLVQITPQVLGLGGLAAYGVPVPAPPTLCPSPGPYEGCGHHEGEGSKTNINFYFADLLRQ